MSIVEYRADCPRCHYRRANIQEMKNQTIIFCYKCGYYSENGKAEKTFGAYAILYKNEPGEVGSIHEPITEKMLSRFEKIIGKENVKKERCYLTRWDKKNKEADIIIGVEENIP